MMVPRSYTLLQQHSPPARERRPTEKMGCRTSVRTISSPTSRPTHIPPPSKQKDAGMTTSTVIMTAPFSTPSNMPVHSKPVVIPPRSPAKTPVSTQTVRVRGHHGGRDHRLPRNHNHDAIPPSVAALLAVTQIPRPPDRRRKGASMNRIISMDELIQEWKQDNADPTSSLTGSPLDLLLGRLDEEDDEYGSSPSMEEGESLASTSFSSESLSSTMPPSLDPDAQSITSTWDNLSTPGSMSRRSSSDRREKVVQSPPKEDCVLDHPLLHFNVEDPEGVSRTPAPDVLKTSPASVTRFKSLKSNLTASFQALKSAAKSFSNFTAPSVPPDDLLTRSLLAPEFTSEMRPKLLQGLPSPALRRYLNPQPTPITPAELTMQLHNALLLDADLDSGAPMIQMQTYDRRTRSSSRKRRSSETLSEAARSFSAPAVRQREPRENSDFLRVIVLEMNMRRVGKLDAKAVGKARIWLPPRKLSPNQTISSDGGTPQRWMGLLAEYE